MPGRSVAAVAIIATAPRHRFWQSRRRTTFSCSRAKLALRAFAAASRKLIQLYCSTSSGSRSCSRRRRSILRRTAACSSRRCGPPCRFSSISSRPVRRSNSCQCNHFDRDGGGLAVQDALHDAVALRFSHSADDRKEQLRNAVPCHVSAKMVSANETPERHSPVWRRIRGNKPCWLWVPDTQPVAIAASLAKVSQLSGDGSLHEPTIAFLFPLVCGRPLTR